jgi:transposase
MRTGWFKEVWVKSTTAHLLASRGMLVATRCALENRIRGLLKTFGLVVGKAGSLLVRDPSARVARGRAAPGPARVPVARGSPQPGRADPDR